jgi:hypothetical protein
MRDGAAAHFSRAVRDVLSKAYHDRCTGRGGTSARPPRFKPDLNPLYFYLWGHLNTLVYAAPVGNEVDVCQTVRNYPGIFARTERPIMRRVEVCNESYGGHFEHLL